MVQGYQVCAQENYIFSYISQYLWRKRTYVITLTRIGTYTRWERWTDIISICNKFLRHIIQISNDKYKWIRVHIIYDLILNFHLCYIHHIRNAYIFVTQYMILTKSLSAINNVGVWIKPHASTHDMMGKELMYRYQMVVEIIFRFHNLPSRKQNRFYNLDLMGFYDEYISTLPFYFIHNIMTKWILDQ